MISTAHSLDIAVALYLPEGEGEKIEATLRGVDTGFLELSSPIYLKEDRALEIVHQTRRLRSTVVYCKRESSGTYDAGVKLALHGEARSDPRTPVNLRTILNISGSLTPLPVRVVNFSASGLGLELPKRIPEGATVSVDVGYGVVIGNVKHFAPSARHYRAGIRLQQFIRRNVLEGPISLSSAVSGNVAAFAAFVRAIEVRQSRYEAILFSLAHSRSTS